jgi:hypothetical protein
MRLPDRPGERGALDERGGTGQVRVAGDVLRQRLDRLAACHPSSPDYAEIEYRELAGSSGDLPDGGYEEMLRPGLPESQDNGELERGELAESRDNGGDAELAGRDGELAGRDGELAGRGGELAGRDGGRANRPGAGRPAGRRAGEPGRWPDGGATGGLGGGGEPYRPWFTAGESPEPWFTGESGG